MPTNALLRRVSWVLAGSALVSGVAWGVTVPPATAQALTPQNQPSLAQPLGKAVIDHPTTMSHPEGVVYRYAALMSQRDYGDAYQLLAPELQQQLPYSDFVAQYGGAAEPMEVLAMVLQPQTSNVERLDYKVLIDRNEASHPAFTQEQEFVLVPTYSGKGAWEIAQISP
jgi:hypothetical protein